MAGEVDLPPQSDEEAVAWQEGYDAAVRVMTRQWRGGLKVYLAEKNDRGTSDIFGVYAFPEDAKQKCQNDAAEYFGYERTPPLKWLGDLEKEGHASASYYDPRGNVLYQVTRYEVKEDCP